MEIITTHKNSDFDAVASVFASSLYYPGSQPVLPGIINQNVREFLSIHKDHFSYMNPKDVDNEKVTRLVIVDANSWNRLEKMEGLRKRDDLEVHVWDHHKGNVDIRAEFICSEKVGAATSLLVRDLTKKGQTISPIYATLFLAGIYEDTGNLTFPSTTAEDARSVGILLEQKADLNIIKNFLRPAYGPVQKDILFEMLQDDQRVKVNGYNISMNRVDITGHTPGLSVVVDMYQDIMNVDAAFGVFSEPKRERCIVIGRSAVDGLHIGSIMKKMGGGGHPNAGSALLKHMDPESVMEWVSELVKVGQQVSVQVSDLMSFPVFTISSGATMYELALLLRERGCTGIPVADEEGRVVGVISRRDFRKVKKNSQMNSPVKAFMSRNIITLEPGTDVNQAARLMVKHDIGRLPIMSDGQLIGIVTRSDAMRYFYDLEEDGSVPI